MSKNPGVKTQAKTTSKTETLKKTTSSSSSDPKKLPNKPLTTRTLSTSKSQEKTDIKKPTAKTTSSTVSSSKDEDKKKKLSTRTSIPAPSTVRMTNGVVSKPSPGKTPLSRSSSSTSSSTTKVKSRGTPERQASILKSKHSATSIKQPNTKQQVSSKPNPVMTTVHNVTVSSPPSKRRELPEQPISEAKEESFRRKVSSSKPDETATLRPSHSESKANEVLTPSVQQPVKVKDPVAFEVIFDETQKTSTATKSPAPSDSSPDYEDDFESYESDFETGSSSAGVPSTSSSSSESSPRGASDSTPTADSSETEPEAHSEDDEESEITQFPITVIHRDKEQERKLDSGNYDLHSKKRRALETFDSLDTLANYEQLDSGISYENSIPTTSLESGAVAFCGYAGFYSRPVITKRGAEIMSKIQFDMITFTLLDLKPIPYDTYMRMFGSFNTLQSTTQTQEDRMESECQTETNDLRSVWTQHPPQYKVQGSIGAPMSSGEGINDEQTKPVPTEDQFDHTLKALTTWRHDASLPDSSMRHKCINFERLNTFLKSSSLLISRILTSNARDRRLTTTDLPALSSGFYKLNTHLLNALRVVRVFANHKFNLILTVHESIANVYQNDFSNLIMVWNSEDPSKPVRLLSTWSEVCQADICNESSDIIVCGLRDGSVVMWDLRETYSFCSKLDGYLTHFAATHSIAPNLEGVGVRTMDLGAVIDVKSFRPSPKEVAGVEIFKTVQFASLNETGILTIWTLMKTGGRNYEITQGAGSKFEYSSPWARVKLIQSAICDLREFMEFGNTRPTSAFERTKLNFQRAIFDDDILKELADTQNDVKLGLQGLRFINLDCGTELIFVGTNRNYVISCSKTLKRERFRKLTITGGGFLFPTAIKLLQNESFLAVGLSNGSVTLLNCNQDDRNKQQKVLDKSIRRPGTAHPTSSEFDFEVGKSCAIQNIIRNERLPPERRFNEEHRRPSTAALIEATADGGKKPFELRVFDEQMLLNGSVLRKDLVRTLAVSSDGWSLLVLSNGNLRVYDFYAEKEVSFVGDCYPRANLVDLAVTRGVEKEKKLVLLTEGNDIEVHLLK